MNYRWFEYLSGLDISTAGTEFINLKGDDPISALMVQVRVTGVTGAPVNPADQAITRLRVVDGSTVLYNTRGIAGVPLNFYTLSDEPILVNTYLNGVQNIASFIIPFGRKLYDPDYALDPSKFKNPKIEIIHNLVNGGLGTPVTASLQVYALMFDQKIPNLRGYLQTKEVYKYTLTDSNVTTVELPIDHPLRAIMVQSRAKGKAMNSQISSMKLNEDNDKHIIFDESVSNLVKLLYPHKIFQESMDGYTNTQTQRLHYGYSTYEKQVVAIPENAATDMNFVWAYGPNIDIRSSGAANFKAMIRGYCPNGMIHIPLGEPNDPMDWLQTRSDMDLDLKITAGGSVLASSQCEVITQQEVLY